MKVLYSGATICDVSTLKRLVLLAKEIGFMDRPSVTFKEWGTIGRDSEIRQFDTSGCPVSFSAHSPPSGPVSELYSRYIEADLANRKFVKIFLEGLASSPIFSAKFVQEVANYGSGTGRQVREALIADTELATASFINPVDHHRMFRFNTQEDRHETLKILLIEASIHITNTLVISERTGLLPVTDDPYFLRLLALRTSDSPYVGDTPRIAPMLGIAVAKAVIPDEALVKISFSDIFDYRKSAKDAYDAWSVEIESLAAQIAELDTQQVEQELPRIIKTQVAPRLIEYRNEMKSVRDKLFGDLIKKIAVWEMPSLSLAYLASLDLASAIALFASALVPGMPVVVDYYQQKRDVFRRNSMSYLIGIASEDECD